MRKKSCLSYFPKSYTSKQFYHSSSSLNERSVSKFHSTSKFFYDAGNSSDAKKTSVNKLSSIFDDILEKFPFLLIQNIRDI